MTFSVGLRHSRKVVCIARSILYLQFSVLHFSHYSYCSIKAFVFQNFITYALKRVVHIYIFFYRYLTSHILILPTYINFNPFINCKLPRRGKICFKETAY